ncbi:MAG: ABC transporter ATP-binding protein, partial [Oscillospiraceae bacterium]|nr:ABC transporter ATP-binding protein [Oscillospiraceae bacterium]
MANERVAKVPAGPRGHMNARGLPKKKVKKGTVKRLMGYIVKGNRLKLLAVVVCIIITAAASVSSSLFIKTLIGDYIEPLLRAETKDFMPLFGAIIKMALIFLAGIVAVYIQNRVMAVVSQGVLRTIRDDMFSHMQTLPIKYFDTNTHGDIMSRYTNDTDTLRQMISQTIPQTMSSAVTVAAVFVAMCSLSRHLTVFVVVSVVLMLLITGKVAGRSGKFFVRQQTSLGDVNGYIEEMINGQKVIKVFCHEEKTKKDFDKKNDELFENAYNANKFANIIGPINNNLGHLQYVLVAVLGGLLCVSGVGGLSFASVASFMQLSKNFVMPINQLSQQLNAVVMAL